jgi:hypothetical protein
MNIMIPMAIDPVVYIFSSCIHVSIVLRAVLDFDIFFPLWNAGCQILGLSEFDRNDVVVFYRVNHGDESWLYRHILTSND